MGTQSRGEPGCHDFSTEDAKTLVNSGFLTLEGILAADVADIAETTGFDEEKAKAISDATIAHTQTQE